MRRLVLLMALVLAPFAAWAQGSPGAGAPDPVDLARALPADLLKTLRRGSSVFVGDMADLIASYGSDRGVDAEGIAWMIAADRARARERAVAQFLRADLDADDQVTRSEMDRAMTLSSEGMRGDLDLAFRAADADGDALVTAAERGAYATDRAMDRMSDEDAVFWQGVMLLDLDGDGFVVIEEVAGAIVLLQDVDLKQVKQDI